MRRMTPATVLANWIFPDTKPLGDVVFSGYRGMLGGRKKFKVVEAVVGLVAILVMNVLVRSQFSADGLFHQPSVFKNPTTTVVNLDVPVSIMALAACAYRLVTHEPRLVPSRSKLLGRWRLMPFDVFVVSLVSAALIELGRHLVSTAALAQRLTFAGSFDHGCIMPRESVGVKCR